MNEHRLKGTRVPKNIHCVFCERKPRKNENFGKGKKDWDVVGMICPDCWKNMLPPEPINQENEVKKWKKRIYVKNVIFVVNILAMF